MPLPSLSTLPSQLGIPSVQKAQHWWRHLTPQRQDRVAVLAPLLAVMLFFAAIVAALAYLHEGIIKPPPDSSPPTCLRLMLAYRERWAA